MKRILKSKKGVSLLEGLIALLLLAVVATGTFGVLLSTARKTSEPDIREEMTLAVEKAQQMLQVYVYPNISSVGISDIQNDIGSAYATKLNDGLCIDEDKGETTSALYSGRHDIDCLLPPVCDKKNSKFYYEVSYQNNAAVRPRSGDLATWKDNKGDKTSSTNTYQNQEIKVNFVIECNGYSL